MKDSGIHTRSVASTNRVEELRQSVSFGHRTAKAVSSTKTQALQQPQIELAHEGLKLAIGTAVEQKVHALRPVYASKNRNGQITGSEHVNEGHNQRLYALYRQIVGLLENDKYYRKPGLSLHMLADELNTNTKYISESVNRHAGCNFMTFVNRYRIQEVCQALQKENALNHILEISMNSGFSSVPTFYRVFKKFLGITPGRYYEMERSQGIKS